MSKSKVEPKFYPLSILLIAIDLFISLITFGWINAVKQALEPKDKLRSVPVADDESHRVRAEFKDDLLQRPRNGTTTLYELSKKAFEDHAVHPCMVQREFVGWKVPKKVKEFTPDKLITRTYAQVGEASRKFGAALRASGCVASDTKTTLDKVTNSSRIAIFENTCPEWMIAAMGAFSQSVTVVTVYATLGLDAVVEAVNDNLVTVIVCNKTNVGYLLERSKDMKTLTTIVYTNDLIGTSMTVDLPTNIPSNVSVKSFAEYVESGDTSKYPPTPPAPESPAVVMYTSGSTGKPKGVMITHKAVIAGCASSEYVIDLGPADKYMAYLPLAHIMELMVEFVIIAGGCCLCYADPKSLTATGAFPNGALEVYSPTLMVAVPKIWDTIKKGVLAKVAKSPPVAQALVYTALEWKQFCMTIGLDTPLFNALVLKKFKGAVGGKIRFTLSGGGPLNGEVQDFIRAAFGFPLVQGYGLTETCAGLAIQAIDDLRHGVQGVPLPSCEVKLVSTPDICDRGGMAYMSTDRSDVDGNPVWGRGEICVYGGNVTSGYYMMPDKTKEEFTDDGWFHTGDIGQFMIDGSIRIVDRKKNLVKLKGGEYVALEKMEMTYGNSDWVDAVAGGICCYGDGDMDRPVALLQLSETHTMKWAKENGKTEDFETLLKSKEVQDAVLDSMKSEHAKSDLSHLEKLVAVALLNSPWTPENGCLTAANKLQRRAVIEQFEKEFNEVKEKGIF